MTRGQAFLARFRAMGAGTHAGAAADGAAAIRLFAEDEDGFSDAVAELPDDFAQAMEEAAADPGFGAPMLLQPDCFASAACDRHGAIVVAGPRFIEWFDSVDPFGAVVRDLGAGRPHVSMLADEHTGRPIAVAAGTVAMARHWPLHSSVRAALDAGRAAFAIVAFRSGEAGWLSAAAAYHLTPAEGALVEALARHGDLQRAAAERGIAYETARKFVASAMRKTGAARQTELVRRTMLLAAGEIVPRREPSLLLRELFGLTARQAQLAALIGQGLTREEAAAELGTSPHRVKADLKAVFQGCGVDSAVDLARLLAEVDALRGLATACEVHVAPRGHRDEPLRLIPRRHGPGAIAVADHGPAGAPPLLIFHPNVAGRHQPHSFVSALRDAGWRPIAVERAGFGLSDPLPGDPVANALADLTDVMYALAIDSAPAIARCTTGAHVACHAAASGRISAAVLISPDAIPADHRGSSRMSDAGRAIFARYPELARAFATMIGRRATSETFARLWRSACDAIPSDLAVIDDPHDFAEVVRGLLQASSGLEGFLAEALAVSRAEPPPRPIDPSRFTVLYGVDTERSGVPPAAAFWRGFLGPDRVEIIGEGLHFLHMTHADRVIAALNAVARVPA